jgi:signal transduction histidine kinase
MRITYRVWLVGGIPIAIAAAIAVTSWFLLKEAERAREGAVLAGSVYRNLLVAMATRDDYLQALPGDRAEHAVRFAEMAEQARADLAALERVAGDPTHRWAAVAARDAVGRYSQRMRQFMVVTTQNDHLAAEMRARVASLTTLTAQARERQRASNADVVASLTLKDRKLRAIRDIVERAHELRAQIAALSLHELQRNYGTNWDAIATADAELTRGLTQLRRTAGELAEMLKANDRAQVADELLSSVGGYVMLVSEPGDPTRPEPVEGPQRVRAGQQLSDWADRLLKVNSSEERALHEEVAQLVTYSVQANETEQATQNIVIETLKLGQRTATALAKLDPAAATGILDESGQLSATVDALPLSPLIQAEMMDAIDAWRARLTTAIEGLRNQNEMIADMDATASAMVDGARSLNETFAREAKRIDDFVRKILIVGASIGLLLGFYAAFFVARSITRPLNSLQQGMRELAQDPLAGPIIHSHRRDELGDMARAANFFVTEIGRREHALRRAKDQADSALAELRQTQADLIQSEKLASLGQLVAGVAHEINTPVGIALTTATALGDEVRKFGQLAVSGQVPKSKFVQFVDRMKEGSQLLFSNLTRAADLVHSFKQVAADQVSSERRTFEMATWAHELLTSLRPVLRRAGHGVTFECQPGLKVDTYPGALAQVLTNLCMNSVIHAFEPGQVGNLQLRIAETRAGDVRIVFADDGKGIPQDYLGKIFDPFFTTARSRGSTGLGLHIAFNLVTSKLQGRIEVASERGKGTRFTINIPAKVSELAPEQLAAVTA